MDFDSPAKVLDTILPSHTYESLTSPRSIRLINLLPSTKQDERLACTLKEVSLDSDPTFQALSYAWGEANFSCDLICNFQAIKITQNLHDALFHFRLLDQEVTIWIDAICINQFDEDEKSEQIPLMADIYHKASNVLIWLGSESEGSSEAMQYLARIGKLFLDRGGRVREPKLEQNDGHGAKNKEIWENVYEDPAIMRKVDTIWKRRWWARRWVIQEVAFAQSATVHCGTAQVAWAILAKAAEVLVALEGDGSQFINRRTGELAGSVCQPLHNATKLDRIRNDLRERHVERTRRLHDCLDDARGFECRDVKDRIFALLGIINYGSTEPFTIAYTKPTAEIFEAFARYCLREGWSIRILSWAGVSNHALCGESLQLPSWVPDWRLPFQSPNDKLQGFDSDIQFKARARLAHSSDGISISGKLVDRVIAVCPCIGLVEEMALEEGGAKWTVFQPSYIMVWYQALEALLRQAFELIHVDVSSAEYVAGGEGIWQALARTLVLDSEDVSFDMKPHPYPLSALMQKDDVPDCNHKPKLTDEFVGFRNQMFRFGELPSPVVVRDATGRPTEPVAETRDSAIEPRDARTDTKQMILIDYEHMEYFTRLVDRCQNRGFFVTKRGYIGLGPKEMQHGDLICDLGETQAPFVLRPQNKDFMMFEESSTIKEDILWTDFRGKLAGYVVRTRREKFQLIGQCYTHGLMSNEAWRNYGLMFEEFVIV